MGKITKLFIGKDQKVRSAKVLVSPHKYVHRPLNLLYPTEYPADKNNETCFKEGDSSTAKEPVGDDQDKNVTPVSYELDEQESETIRDTQGVDDV